MLKVCSLFLIAVTFAPCSQLLIVFQVQFGGIAVCRVHYFNGPCRQVYSVTNITLRSLTAVEHNGTRTGTSSARRQWRGGTTMMMKAETRLSVRVSRAVVHLWSVCVLGNGRYVRCLLDVKTKGSIIRRKGRELCPCLIRTLI